MMKRGQDEGADGVITGEGAEEEEEDYDEVRAGGGR